MTVSPAIAKEIRRIADMLYGSSGFGPSVQQWNRYRNPDLPTARPVIVQSGGGYAGGKPEWTAILETINLRYPARYIAQHADKMTTHRDKNPIWEEDLPEGLPVIPCAQMRQYEGQRVRRIWCPNTYRYRRVATAQTFLVR